MNDTLPGKAGIRSRLEQALAVSQQEKYVLRLVIAGNTRRSNAAVTNIKEICEKFLFGRYELEIIDMYQQPEWAEGLQIVAAPTLLKQLPLPQRTLVGNLAEVSSILLALDLPHQQQKDMET